MFVLTKIEGGRINVPEPEYLVCSAAVSKGAACTLTSGKLAAIVAGTTEPTYIALAGAKAANETIPACRIEPNQVYEVPISDTPTSLNVGDKVTIEITDSNGCKVTATTTNGVATIVSLNDASVAGDKILVRFA